MNGSCTCRTSKSPSAQPAADPGGGDAGRTTAGRRSRCSGTGTARPAGTTYGGSALVVVGRGQHADRRARARSASRPGRARGAAPRRARRTSTGRRCRCARRPSGSPVGGGCVERPWGRSSSQSRCSMCQSAGCAAIPAARSSAIRWVSSRTRYVQRRPLGGHGSGPSRRPRGRVRLVPHAHHVQRGAGTQGEQRRAGRHPGPAAEEVAPRRRARTGPGRRAAARRSPGPAAPPARRTAAGRRRSVGRISMPSARRKSRNRW